MRRIDRLLKATSFRVAALQTCLFLVMFAIAAGAGLVVLRRAEMRAARAEIEQAEDDLSRHILVHGLQGFENDWRGLVQDPGIEIRLEDGAGRPIVGHLPHVALPTPTPHKVVLDFRLDAPPAPGRSRDRFLAINHVEPGGMRLTVAENLIVRQRQDNALLLVVASIAALTAALGTGVAVSSRSGTDLDDLARTLNQMMERENRLVEGLRQVSWAIAHDLRRPLAYHNQEISTALQRPASVEGYRAALESASRRIDDVLQTFQALLRIAELEAGRCRAVDISWL